MPVRIEVGPRDLAEGNVTVVRRDVGEKVDAAVHAGRERRCRACSRRSRPRCWPSATEFRDSLTVDVESIDDAIEAGMKGAARLPWGLVDAASERRLIAETLSVRCIQRADGTIPDSEDEPDLVAVVARAY